MLANTRVLIHATLYVANSGASHDDPGYGTNTSCSHAYRTIDFAIGQASAGDTVLVCPGAYSGQVLIDKSIVLRGLSHPVIDPGLTGIAVTVAADDAAVRGLTLQDSFAGIDVEGARHARITGNTVRSSLIGITVERTVYSSITGNVVDGNLCAGIALFALGRQQTAHVVVAGNQVEDNVSARCLKPSPGFSVRLLGLSGGIVLAAQAGGQTVGNLVSRNVVIGNGDNKTLPGAGIVLEVPFGISFTGTDARRPAPRPGAARPLTRSDTPVAGGTTAGNTVVGNRVAGNGLPGVTVLSASPAGSGRLNGNVIVRNLIGRNNGEGLPADRRTTAVLVAAGSPLTVDISSNAIVGDYLGVWLSPEVLAPSAIFNQFVAVQVPVFRSPA